MFAEKHFPEILFPGELDQYLAKGWYRMGQSLFTTNFLYFHQDVYSAVWIRLFIPDHRLKKSARKLINQVTGKFQIKLRQGFISEEKERLFQKYKASFDGHLASSLSDSLLDGEDYNLFDTWEVAIYDQDRLIAFSFFDIGQNSVASIQGVYDPEYRKYSLGYFTMLMEIGFCQDNQIQYYYPGYVVPGYNRFDYKLRIGDVEYYEMVTQQWCSYTHFDPEAPPIQQMKNKLLALEKALFDEEIAAKSLIYPFFEANLFSFWPAKYIDHPLILQIEISTQHPLKPIVAYDLKTANFILMYCISIKEISHYFNKRFLSSLDPGKHYNEILIKQQIVLKSQDTRAILEELKVPNKLHLLSLLNQHN